jgi:hypothetical protein
MSDFLTHQHEVYGVTVQNWMVIAIVMVVGAIIWAVKK